MPLRYVLQGDVCPGRTHLRQLLDVVCRCRAGRCVVAPGVDVAGAASGPSVLLEPAALGDVCRSASRLHTGRLSRGGDPIPSSPFELPPHAQTVPSAFGAIPLVNRPRGARCAPEEEEQGEVWPAAHTLPGEVTASWSSRFPPPRRRCSPTPRGCHRLHCQRPAVAGAESAAGDPSPRRRGALRREARSHPAVRVVLVGARVPRGSSDRGAVPVRVVGEYCHACPSGSVTWVTSPGCTVSPYV